MANADTKVVNEEIKDFAPKPFRGKVYFKPEKSNNIMRVPFGRYFNFGTIYEQFKMSLSSKRIFKRFAEKIAEDSNRILNHHFTESLVDIESGNKIKRNINKKNTIADQFIFAYLSLKMNIDDGGELTKLPYPIFITELMNLISDDIVKMIVHYVDINYVGSMDDAIDMEKHTFEMSTTFMDSDIKHLCYVKYAGNLLIPLCTHYCNIMIRDVDPKEFFLDLYKSLFKRISQDPKQDVLAKLHKYITMIVSNAFKIHKPIYNRMSISGTTRDSEIEEVFAKILTTIITKIKPIDTVPAYIAEAAKSSSSKYKNRTPDGYNLLQGFSDDYVHSGTEDSVVTEADRMESRIARPDELLKVVRKYSCDDTINKISMRYKVYIDDYDEYLFTVNNLDLHEYQTKIIFQTFSHAYGGYENMFDNNRHNYCRLLILASKHLRNIGLDVIADYICARCVGYSFQNRWGGKISDRKLFEDPRYDELINGKYKYSKAQFENKNFIRDDVVMLMNNMFKYNCYGDERNGNTIKHTDEEVIDAVLEYYLKGIV